MFKNLFSKNKGEEIKTVDSENILVENEENINSVDDNQDMNNVEENIIESNITEDNQSEKNYRLALTEFSKLLFESPNFNSNPFADDMNNNDYSKYLKVINFIEQVAKKDINLAVDLIGVMKESIKVGTLNDALVEGKKLLASRLENKNKSI